MTEATIKADDWPPRTPWFDAVKDGPPSREGYWEVALAAVDGEPVLLAGQRYFYSPKRHRWSGDTSPVSRPMYWRGLLGEKTLTYALKAIEKTTLAPVVVPRTRVVLRDDEPKQLDLPIAQTTRRVALKEDV